MAKATEKPTATSMAFPVITGLEPGKQYTPHFGVAGDGTIAYHWVTDEDGNVLGNPPPRGGLAGGE